MDIYNCLLLWLVIKTFFEYLLPKFVGKEMVDKGLGGWEAQKTCFSQENAYLLKYHNKTPHLKYPQAKIF